MIVEFVSQLSRRREKWNIFEIWKRRETETRWVNSVLGQLRYEQIDWDVTSCTEWDILNFENPSSNSSKTSENDFFLNYLTYMRVCISKLLEDWQSLKHFFVSFIQGVSAKGGHLNVSFTFYDMKGLQHNFQWKNEKQIFSGHSVFFIGIFYTSRLPTY